MTLDLLSKLRKELYNISEIENFEDTIHSQKDDNEAILNFLRASKGLRNKSESEILNAFIPTLKQNRLLAMKSLFFIRDKVSGLGERRVFKIIINYLAINESEFLEPYLLLINKYGRWDDYYALFYTPLENEVINIFKKQISMDLQSKNPSTLAKWLKSENTSSKTSRILAIKTRKLLGYTSQEYRLILSSLRRKIGIIERKLSLKEFNSIDYNKLSLDTCLRYKKAFIHNDKNRYIKHIKNYSKNENDYLYKKQVNNINQTPFNLIELILNNKKNITNELRPVYSRLWDIICNNYKEMFEDTYVIIALSDDEREDFSTAYKAALSIILFCNKLNSSVYKDYYMYFKNQPRFGKIQGSDIVEQVEVIKNLEYYTSYNIESALDLLLFTSIKKELPNDNMPKNILIISDLDLENKYKGSHSIQLIKNKWSLSGYLVPKLKFWQIEGNEINKGISKDIYSNIFAKGYSREIFISLLKSEIINSEDLPLKSLENSRYSEIL